MQKIELKAGLMLKDIRYKNRIVVITSITDKRVNMDDPTGFKYTSSTGRSSSKFYLGIKTFNKQIEDGFWIIYND